MLIINQHRYQPLDKLPSIDSTKDFLFQYKEDGKTTKQNYERMKEAMVSNSAKGSSFCNSGGMIIIPTERESQKNNSSATSVNNNLNMRVRSNNKEPLFDHSNNNNSNIGKDNMIHILTLGKRCISTIELPTTKEEKWKVCNKLEEDNIIDNNEVIKVNVKQSDKTIEEKFKRNAKIEEVTNSPKVDARTADKEATDTIDDDVDTKAQVVTTIRLTHQDCIEKKVQEYSVPKEINIESENKSISKLGKSNKSLVILPLTIKDDLLSSNKLETIEKIDNNVVTKVNAEQ